MENNELMRYGVLGMKWGKRRASKKGTTYTYESSRTKMAKKYAVGYNKRTQRLKSAADKALSEGNTKKADKYTKKADKMQKTTNKQKKWALASAKHDALMQKRAESISTGKAIAQTMLTFGMNKTYHSIMVSTEGSISKGRAVAETMFYGYDRHLGGYLVDNS